MQTESDFNRNSESLFLLKRADNSSTCGSVQVSFSPVPTSETQTNALDVQKVVYKSHPIFNTDRNYFTPCFILQVDKNRYVENESIYLTLHQKKKEELCQSKSQLFLARPSKNCSVCWICKKAFDDYLQHVTHPEHIKGMRESPFTPDIEGLCAKFQTTQSQSNNKKLPKGTKNQQRIKTKKIQKIPKALSKKLEKKPLTSQNKLITCHN